MIDFNGIEKGKFYTVRQTAKICQVREGTIRKWKDRGVIKSYKLGGKVLFQGADIIDALKRYDQL